MKAGSGRFWNPGRAARVILSSPLGKGPPRHGIPLSRSSLWGSAPLEGQGVHPDRPSHPGPLHRGQHRGLHGRELRAAPAPARGRVGPDPPSLQQLPQGRGRARGHERGGLLRPPPRADGLRGTGPLPALPGRGGGRTGVRGAVARHRSHALALPPPARAAPPRPDFHRGGRGGGGREESRAQLRPLAAPGRRPEDRGQGPAPRGRALHGGGRDAQGFLLPGAGRDAVATAGLHPGAEGPAPQQRLGDDRAPQARRDASAGAGAGRRPERRQPRALSRDEDHPPQRRLPHARGGPPRGGGARGQGHALPSLGRRALRAA